MQGGGVEGIRLLIGWLLAQVMLREREREKERERERVKCSVQLGSRYYSSPVQSSPINKVLSSASRPSFPFLSVTLSSPVLLTRSSAQPLALPFLSFQSH